MEHQSNRRHMGGLRLYFCYQHNRYCGQKAAIYIWGPKIFSIFAARSLPVSTLPTPSAHLFKGYQSDMVIFPGYGKAIFGEALFGEKEIMLLLISE